MNRIKLLIFSILTYNYNGIFLSCYNILGTILELKGSLKVTEGNYKSLLSEINSSGATRLGTANAKGETPEALRIKELEEENQALKGELNMLKNQQSRIDDCINK